VKIIIHPLLTLAFAAYAGAAFPAEPTPAEQAFQDHAAYVNTFTLPVIIEKCEALQPGYMVRAAPLYFRFAIEKRENIERGRLLTLSEIPQDWSIKEYHDRVLAKRLGPLDAGSPEDKRQICDAGMSVLSGARVPGTWPVEYE
jgi:hypothetical protein